MRYLIGLLLLALSLPCWAQDYEVKIDIPAPKGYEAFVDDYKTRVENEFVREFEEAKAESQGGHMNPWTLALNGTVEYQDKFLVLAVSGYDYRGGAHGLPVLEVFLFDTATQKPIQQQELFEDPGKAYGELSRLTRADLIKQGFDKDDEWMQGGTEPKADNFTGVVPTKKGVTVVFPSYQVAPYAAGTPTVELTWDQTRGLFKSKYAPD